MTNHQPAIVAVTMYIIEDTYEGFKKRGAGSKKIPNTPHPGDSQ